MTARVAIEDRQDEIISINPATGKELGRVRVETRQDIDAAVARARSAQPQWGSLPFRTRARTILSARRLLYERQDEIAKIISDETGKPPFEALSTEVFPVADLMSHYAAQGRRILKDERFTLAVFRNKRSAILYEPRGVVGIISPWNFPFAIPMGEVVMALITGNSVVLKPSEYTPLVAEAMRRLFADAGLPEGVLQVVQGGGATGSALVESQIDKLFFTGSVRTGRKIAERAGSRLLPVVLELGGKDAMIVCEDALFERTVKGAVWGAFANCGQVCASVERLYVVEAVAERFIEAVVAETRRLRLGVDIGPLTNENQLNVVMDHVSDAVAKGARAITGGRRREDLGGYYYEPTVLTGVNDTMKVMNEETFGPVLPIVVVKDEEEALRRANLSDYGLLASVWTSSNRKGRRLARRIEAGTIVINDVMYTHGAAQTPWFGVKQSGIGVTHGKSGLLEFVRMKHVNWDLVPLKRNLWWFPYTGRGHSLFRELMRFLYRWGLRRIV
jgi:succinate-semialdehyde dehydrogenase/glutarate-semialdehyde dehydrogenase